MLFCVSRSCSSCVINNKSHLQILIYWYLNTRLVKNLGTAWTVENFKYMPSIQMHLSSTCHNTHNTGYLRPMCRTKSNRRHTTGPVRQRGRQHGRADCSRSAAESDAFSWRPRHPCQSRIRDRDRPVVGLTHFACGRIKVDLFNKVLKIPIHVLHPVLPSPVSHTQRYGLRPRIHDRTLPERTSNLVDCNFIVRMLYLNAYWLNIGLRYKYVIFFTVCRRYISHCVKMRYVILSIKRLLIDWLIDWLCRSAEFQRAISQQFAS